MKKFVYGLLVGMFIATYGTEGVFTLVENVTGIVKTELDEVIKENDK